jgi:uncharacterized protein (TIGR02646 family)
MIRIQRPSLCPDVLTKKGKPKAAAHCRAHARGKPIEVDSGIYGHTSVKEALLAAQHDKCCFCESKIAHVAFGHVEHFRPKGGVRQAKGKPLETPGYFWLAYSWDNLLVACELCNTRFKGNLFPLRDPSRRAKRKADKLTLEEPMFLDPASEDPQDHIGFREEYPFAINGSDRGELTWQALGLAREPLADRRREHLEIVKGLKAIRDGVGSATDQKIAEDLLAKFAAPKAQWSSMVQAALR